MYMLLLLLGALLHSSEGQGPTGLGTAQGCLSYGANCTNSDQCCFYPSILCLPDVRNGTACLSIFDVVNLNPSVSGTNLIGPLVTALGNSSTAVGEVQEVVKVNGTTVYNLTEVILPSSTPGYGSPSSSTVGILG